MTETLKNILGHTFPSTMPMCIAFVTHSRRLERYGHLVKHQGKPMGVTYLLFPFMKATTRQSWAIGTTWLFPTVFFEFGFGRFIMGKPWEVMLKAYDMRGGNLWVIVLFVVSVSPYLVSRIRGKATTS